MSEVVAFTYQADIHCFRCTEKGFGRTGIQAAIDGEDSAPRDGEGNPIRPFYDYDIKALEDDRRGISCGTCMDLIEPIEEIVRQAWEDNWNRQRVYHVYDPDFDADSLPGFSWDAVKRDWIDACRSNEWWESVEVDDCIESALNAYCEEILRLNRVQERATYELDLLDLAA